MTDSDSPSALLERAAELIEYRASLAIAGPWATAPRRVVAGPDEDREVAYCHSQTTAAWIAMFDPIAAQPLVEWLRQAAFAYRLDNDSAQDEHALAFARTVLGEPLNHDWFFPYDSHPGARECSRCGAHDDSQPCR